jgi:carboxylesterase type B
LYLGLPYANPPTGNNRFRAPPPLDKASLKKDRDAGKVVDATEYPEFCVQGSIGQGDAGGAGSEDCLKVNVYTPKGAKSGSNRESFSNRSANCA